MINLNRSCRAAWTGRSPGPRTLARLVFLLALLDMIPSLRALEMEPLPIAGLTQRAQLVVHGHVLSKTCQVDPAGRIFTTVELEVTDVWKGEAAPGRLKIFHGGGALGDRQSVVAGQAEYRIGEEVVAFLVRNSRGEAVTLGLAQGKFNVTRDARTGEKLARNPFHGGSAEERASALTSKLGTALETPPGGLSLSQLKQQVRGGAR